MKVELYGKPDCGLCDEAKVVIERVRRTLPFELEVVDITGNAELEARYGLEIPVVFVAGRKAFKVHVDERELRRKLGRAET